MTPKKKKKSRQILKLEKKRDGGKKHRKERNHFCFAIHKARKEQDAYPKIAVIIRGLTPERSERCVRKTKKKGEKETERQKHRQKSSPKLTSSRRCGRAKTVADWTLVAAPLPPATPAKEKKRGTPRGVNVMTLVAAYSRPRGNHEGSGERTG